MQQDQFEQIPLAQSYDARIENVKILVTLNKIQEKVSQSFTIKGNVFVDESETIIVTLLLGFLMNQLKFKINSDDKILVSLFNHQTQIYNIFQRDESNNKVFKFDEYVSPQQELIILIRNNVDSQNINKIQEFCSQSRVLQQFRSCQVQGRLRERSIADIINSVTLWRYLYSGCDGKRFTLEQAAAIVAMPKKSLDDYYQQIKLGRRYGFDFEKYRHDKAGRLRNYVRKFKNAVLEEEN